MSAKTNREGLNGGCVMIPYRCKLWHITDKGKERLRIKGGHDSYCLACGLGEGPEPEDISIEEVKEKACKIMVHIRKLKKDGIIDNDGNLIPTEER